jgi:hypothetical protein
MKRDVHDIQESTSTMNTAKDRHRSETNAGSWKTGGGDQEEMRRKAEAAATPGPAHRTLDAFVGNWKAEVKCWMEPGGSPEVTQATANARWTLNGRFMEEEFHGEMMGKPFSGLTLLGYDNTKQTFNTVWVSDMQTSIFTSEGKGENGNKVITLEGQTTCAATDRKDITMKTVFRVLNPDKHVFEMYDKSQGENAKVMEIIYTRQ